jgi:predicted nucleic acid-binding protein
VIIVADASPVQYLVLIEQIEIVGALYREVLVPDTVARELQHPRTPTLVVRWIAHPPAWFRVEPAAGPTDAALDELDPGERDAIRLALAYDVRTLLIDDAEGRREAERRRLKVTGTLGILERGAERDLLDLPTALARLLATNFRAQADLIAGLLEREAARKRQGPA